jgi:hypothetical protein
VLRGARQVGKTWLVRNFAQRHDLSLVELNFERFPNLADLFSTNDPETILKNIEAETGKSIEPDSSLLFLDEIQAAAQLFSNKGGLAEQFVGQQLRSIQTPLTDPRLLSIPFYLIEYIHDLLEQVVDT